MKKSNFNLRIILALLALWLSLPLGAQTNVNMAPNGATAGTPFTIAPPANCLFNFFDSGGPAANYNLNADASVTFAPSNPTTYRVQVSFTAGPTPSVSPKNTMSAAITTLETNEITNTRSEKMPSNHARAAPKTASSAATTAMGR